MVADVGRRGGGSSNASRGSGVVREKADVR